VSTNFRPPKKNKLKEWKKLENKFYNHNNLCSGMKPIFSFNYASLQQYNY
jgi:hypothetical protein